MKLSDGGRDFLRLVFDETGGIPLNYVALTDLPVAAQALVVEGFLVLRPSGPDTWQVALTSEGSAWAHLHFVT